MGPTSGMSFFDIHTVLALAIRYALSHWEFLLSIIREDFGPVLDGHRLDAAGRVAEVTRLPCGMPRRRVAYGHRRMPHRGKQGPTTAGSARVIRESRIQKSRIWAINPYCFQRCAGQNGSFRSRAQVSVLPCVLMIRVVCSALNTTERI